MDSLAEQLLSACESGDISTVRKYVESGVSPSIVWDFPSRAYKHGNSALMWATRFGHLSIVQYLLDRHADTTHARPYFGDVLHTAAFHNQSAIGQYLIANGHDIETRTKPCERTPLHVACGQLSFDFAKMIIQAGGHISAVDDAGCTPLDLASLYADRTLFNFIEQSGGVAGSLKRSH